MPQNRHIFVNARKVYSILAILEKKILLFQAYFSFKSLVDYWKLPEIESDSITSLNSAWH